MITKLFTNVRALINCMRWGGAVFQLKSKYNVQVQQKMDLAQVQPVREVQQPAGAGGLLAQLPVSRGRGAGAAACKSNF
jgi:hypothetical protein